MILAFCRDKEWNNAINDQFDLDNVSNHTFTSEICIAEIRTMANRRKWGTNRRKRLEAVLSNLPVVEVERTSLIDSYVAIRSWTEGLNRGYPDHIEPLKQARVMNDHDIWIAALAHVTKSTLITADSDFTHLDHVWINVAFIDQANIPNSQ